jgi:hypothetical protein
LPSPRALRSSAFWGQRGRGSFCYRFLGKRDSIGAAGKASQSRQGHAQGH